MITIHIVGDGAPLYSLKTLLEVNQDKFKEEIEVVGFGDHYFNPVYIRKFSSSLTLLSGNIFKSLWWTLITLPSIVCLL